MKFKIFVIASAIAALMSPLVASAATLPAIPFADLTSVNYALTGTAKPSKFTVIDLTSTTTKVRQSFVLSNGAIDPGSSATFIFDKKSTVANPMQGLKINFNEIIIDYFDSLANLSGQARLRAVVLRNGPKSTSASGQGRIEIDIPASTTFLNAAFANFTGTTAKGPVTAQQVVVVGAVAVTTNIKNDISSGIFTVGAIKPEFATIQTVTKKYTIFGNISTTENTTQNLNTSGAVFPGGKIDSFTIFP